MSARSSLFSLLLAASLLPTHLLAADASPTEAPAPGEKIDRPTMAKRDAKVAMQAWLQLIEDGKYIDSWKTASKPFQQSIGAGRWAMTCRNQRKPTGKMVERVIEEEHYHTEFYKPNGHLTEGEMVTFLFKTSFEHLKEAREVVILCPFGHEWKVVSYALKPKFEPAKTDEKK